MVKINPRTTWAAGAALIGIASFVFWPGADLAPDADLAQGSDKFAKFEVVPYATPAGITLQPLGKAAGYSMDKQSAAAIPRDEIVFADPTGMTLYTFGEDLNGKSVCNGECTATFPPLVASARAEPFGDWSLIRRDGGARQWALKGKPLYTYVQDIDPGSVAGNSPAATGAPRLDRAGKLVGAGLRGYRGERPEPKILPVGWQPAHLFPMPSLDLPPGIAVKEVPDVSAFALVDIMKHTLYVFDGEVGKETGLCDSGSCLDKWAPLAAPLITQPIGDFDVVDREDGIRQWTYKGKGLYTFSGDLAAGYANGADRRVGWRVAAVTQLFNPPGVTIENTVTRGAVLAANDGMTLYRRDGHIFQSGGGHNLRRGAPKRPAVGRDLGTDPRCGAECLQVWSPFLVASDDAEPRGFWDIAVREDGRRQWNYQGYAMWTYAKDKKPGDMFGHDIYDITLKHTPDEVVEVGTTMAGGAALWWSIAVP